MTKGLRSVQQVSSSSQDVHFLKKHETAGVLLAHLNSKTNSGAVATALVNLACL
jgi:hypothetical protein